MANCTIQLDNFQRHYSGGNTVAGRVVCYFNKPKSIRAIKIKLLGKEHTDWTKEESYYDDHEKQTKYRTVTYSGNNTILCMEQILSREGDYSMGRYEYSFSFVLPTRLPDTFRNQYGYIKYYVKAVVDRPYRMDYESEYELNLLSPVDLMDVPSISLNPSSYSDDKTLCCCCCARGLITMNVHLEKETFVAGEFAKIKLGITNLSNENVIGIKAQITTIITSKVTSPSLDSKDDTELVASYVDTGVGANGERTYNFDLHIPQSTGVPNFTCSTLFSKYSSLKVTAQLPACHTNLNIETSVTLVRMLHRRHQPLANAPIQQTQDAPYPTGGVCPPPYSTAPPSHPFPKVHLQRGALPPCPSSSSGFVPNAPPQESTPSAPSKAQIAEDGDFIILNDDEPVPPSYNEAMKNVGMPHPSK